MSNIIGFDSGTMNLCCAKYTSADNVKIELLRNMFLQIDPQDISSSEISKTNWDYIEQKGENGETESIYIIGEDTFKFANIFGKTVSRPMSNGVISVDEIDAQDVLTLMTKKLVGKVRNGYCCFSIPAQSVDEDIPSVTYHESVWKNIFKVLGYTSISLNEAQAIIYSECEKTNYSGIAISFGCGLTNVCACYKGTPTLKFSVARGGDWIDKQTATAVGMSSIPTRITRIKEKDLDLLNPNTGNKKERKIKNTLVHFYNELISHVLEVFKEQFNMASDGLEIEDGIPIVVSGGTSMPKGFIDTFNDVFNQIKDFPYQITEIRHSNDPLYTVCKGCLRYAKWKYDKNSDPKKQE